MHGIMDPTDIGRSITGKSVQGNGAPCHTLRFVSYKHGEVGMNSLSFIVYTPLVAFQCVHCADCFSMLPVWPIFLMQIKVDLRCSDFGRVGIGALSVREVPQL